MNKKLLFSVMLVCFLTLSFVFAGCATTDSGNQGTAPTLTDFITLNSKNAVSGNWIPQTTFAVDEEVEVGVKGTDPDKDVRTFVLTVKKDGKEVNGGEMDFNLRFIKFTQFWGYWTFSTAGEYTMEIYVVDRKRNQSNVLTAAFTVQ